MSHSNSFDGTTENSSQASNDVADNQYDSEETHREFEHNDLEDENSFDDTPHKTPRQTPRHTPSSKLESRTDQRMDMTSESDRAKGHKSSTKKDVTNTNDSYVENDDESSKHEYQDHHNYYDDRHNEQASHDSVSGEQAENPYNNYESDRNSDHEAYHSQREQDLPYSQEVMLTGPNHESFVDVEFTRPTNLSRTVQNTRETLQLVYPNENIVYFTESVIPDTTSDSIFIDTVSQLLNLRSTATIHSQVWVTTHRIVVKRFYGRDGDGNIDTPDEEDMHEYRSDELLSMMSSIIIRRESSTRSMIHTPMLGWSSTSPLQRILGQAVRALDLFLLYGPVFNSILISILLFVWIITFSVSNDILWRIFIGLFAVGLLLQISASIIFGVIYFIRWYYWWRLQNQQGASNRSLTNTQDKKAELEGQEMRPQEDPSHLKRQNRSSRSTGVPLPITIKKIVLFTSISSFSLIATSIALILLLIGNIVALFFAFFVHIVATLGYTWNVFVFIPSFRHNYPAIVKILYGDSSISNDAYISLSSSDEQKTIFVLYQLIGCISSCGIGSIFTCLSYLKQQPSSYRSLKDIAKMKNRSQVLFLPYQDAVQLRNVITALRYEIHGYIEDDDAIFYERNIQNSQTASLALHAGSLINQHIMNEPSMKRERLHTQSRINDDAQDEIYNDVTSESGNTFI